MLTACGKYALKIPLRTAVIASTLTPTPPGEPLPGWAFYQDYPGVEPAPETPGPQWPEVTMPKRRSRKRLSAEVTQPTPYSPDQPKPRGSL